jgi:hypothetical protein
MRRLPYPIKALSMAQLAMVTLLTVSSFSYGGVMAGPQRPPSLVVASFNSSDPSHEWSLSFPSSLAHGWPLGQMVLSLSLSANGGSPTYLGLQHLHAQKMEGRTATLANRPRPILTWFSHPFTPMGPLDILHFAPFNYIIWTTSSSHPR